ncbi:MAG: sialidase family protein, partial [Bacteroidota bacterium]
MVLSNDGLLVTGGSSGPFRLNISEDGGFSWIEADIPREAGVNCLHQTRHPRFEGALFACERTERLWTSPDGRTWQDFYAFPFPNEARAILDLYEGPHAGRLLVALLFADAAVRYTDDGGFSWWNAQGAPFALRAHLTWLPAGVHGPDGVVLATSDAAGLWASTDGGSTWARRARFEPGAFGLEQPNRLFVAPGADGVLWALVADNPGGPRPEGQGVVLRSEDAGVTWTEVPGWPGYGVYGVVVDSQGRLVVGTDAGVWRSQAGVVAVASEEPSPGKPAEAFALGAPYPNPTREAVTVPLTLAEPGAVRVVVVDVLGRQVAVLAEGARAAGT